MSSIRHVYIFVLLLAVLPGCRRTRSVGPVAFVRLTGDYWQIWAMNPDASGAVQITKSDFDKRYPLWMPDGRTLLFRDNNNRVFTVDSISGVEKQILEDFGMVGGLAPSPDGDMLLAARFRTGLKDSSDLWLVSPDGKERTILTREGGLQSDPAWSPAGGLVAYISGRVLEAYELWVMKPDGAEKRMITDNTALELLPAFSHDGKKLAYASDVTGDYEIWVVGVDGRGEVRLTDSRGIDTRCVWSPDDREIMFVSSRSGSLQIWIMNSDGSNQRQLTNGAPSMEPAWR